MLRIPSIHYLHYLLVFLLPFLLAVLSAPIPHYNLSKRETTGEKLVFSHFMVRCSFCFRFVKAHRYCTQ